MRDILLKIIDALQEFIPPEPEVEQGDKRYRYDHDGKAKVYKVERVF